MNRAGCGRLGRGAAAFRWLFEPAGAVSEAGRSFLLGQLLSAPLAAIMGSCCAITVVAVALLRTGESIYGLLITLELVLIAWRVVDWRRRSRRASISSRRAE